MGRASDESLDIIRLLGQMYLLHGRPEKAVILLRALCILNPGDRRAMRSFARAAIKSGQVGEAMRSLDQLRDSGDPSPVVYLLQGQALAALGRHTEAEQMFTEFYTARTSNDGETRS